MQNRSEICNVITNCCAYVDTTVVWFQPLKTLDEGSGETRLRNLRKDQHLGPAIRACAGKAWPEYEPMKYDPRWRTKLTLQRPSDAALEYLHDSPFEYLITRVDFALDFTTATVLEAERVQEWFDIHFVKPWPGKQQLGRVKGTTYSSDLKVRAQDRRPNGSRP